eukprot:1180054-Prorocentrum_minimum.AAC.3
MASQPQTSSWSSNQLADPTLVDSVDIEMSSQTHQKKRSDGVVVFKTGKDFKMPRQREYQLNRSLTTLDYAHARRALQCWKEVAVLEHTHLPPDTDTTTPILTPLSNASLPPRPSLRSHWLTAPLPPIPLASRAPPSAPI